MKDLSPTTNALLGMVRRVLSDIDRRVRVGVHIQKSCLQDKWGQSVVEFYKHKGKV